MKYIKLSQNKFTMVDDKDFDYLNQWKWAYFKAKDGCERVVRNDGKTSVYMHRVIMAAEKEVEVDHINRNGLDNRRANLRIATRSQNAANRGKQVNNTSGFVGVSWVARYKKWYAYVKKDGKMYNLGLYDKVQDAVAVRDKKNAELHGQFAALNGYSLG